MTPNHLKEGFPNVFKKTYNNKYAINNFIGADIGIKGILYFTIGYF